MEQLSKRIIGSRPVQIFTTLGLVAGIAIGASRACRNVETGDNSALNDFPIDLIPLVEPSAMPDTLGPDNSLPEQNPNYVLLPEEYINSKLYVYDNGGFHPNSAGLTVGWLRGIGYPVIAVVGEIDDYYLVTATSSNGDHYDNGLSCKTGGYVWDTCLGVFKRDK